MLILKWYKINHFLHGKTVLALLSTCMKERMGEDVVESQADSYVDKLLTAVNMEGRLYTGNQPSN